MTALPLSGGRMLGPLELDDDPVSAMEAASKQYVDAGVGSALPAVPPTPIEPGVTTVAGVAVRGAVRTATVVWLASATVNGHGFYEVQLDTSNTFASPDLRSSRTTATLASFGDLPPGNVVYARVRPVGANLAVGGWSVIATATLAKADGSDIQAGSITADHAVFASGAIVDANIANLNGDKIVANSIDVAQLRVLPTNLWPDPYCEVGTPADFYRAGDATFTVYTGDRAHTGTRAFQIQTTQVVANPAILFGRGGGGLAPHQDHLPVGAGDTVSISFWASRGGSAPADGGRHLRPMIQFRDAAGAVVSTVTPAQTETVPFGTTHVRRQLSAVAPTGTAYVLAGVRVHAGENAGVVYYVDSFRLALGVSTLMIEDFAVDVDRLREPSSHTVAVVDGSTSIPAWAGRATFVAQATYMERRSVAFTCGVVLSIGGVSSPTISASAAANGWAAAAVPQQRTITAPGSSVAVTRILLTGGLPETLLSSAAPAAAVASFGRG